MCFPKVIFYDKTIKYSNKCNVLILKDKFIRKNKTCMPRTNYKYYPH